MTERLTNEITKLKFSGKKLFALAVGSLLISLIPDISYADGCITLGGSGGGFAGGIGIGIGDGGLSLGCGGGGDGGIGGALCTVVNWFTGPVGSAIASLAVIFLGISAFFGKVNWGTALLFATGIFAIFGAEDIVAAIVGGGFSGCGGGGSGFNFGFGISGGL